MYSRYGSVLLGGTLALLAQAAPQSYHLVARQDAPNNTAVTAVLPQNDSNPSERKAAVAYRNANFIYGPSLIGEAAPFPNGTLGNARTKSDMDLYAPDRANIDARVAKDAQAIQAAIVKVSHDMSYSNLL